MIMRYITLTVLLSMAGLGGYVWVLGEKLGAEREKRINAEQSYNATMDAVGEYATRVHSYSADIAKLQEDYDYARDEAERLSARLADHDLAAILARKPGLVANNLNVATVSVWGDFKAATRSGAAKPAASTEAGAGQPATDAD